MAERPDAPLGLSRDGAGSYVIKVQGRLERHWEVELQMSLTYAHSEGGDVSVLAGRLPDQSALLGILGRLSMWGYLIISVAYDHPLAGVRDDSFGIPA